MTTTYRVCRARSDASHDGNQDVLLDRERARVELESEDRPSGKCPGEETANGERYKLSDELANDDGRVAEEEKFATE